MTKKATKQVTITLNSLGIVQGVPCVRCGKVIRNDYNGFCMDCADELGISEFFKNTEAQLKKKIVKDYKKGKWYANTRIAWGSPPVYTTSEGGEL
jgi:hypothetical protein